MCLIYVWLSEAKFWLQLEATPNNHVLSISGKLDGLLNLTTAGGRVDCGNIGMFASSRQCFLSKIERPYQSQLCVAAHNSSGSTPGTSLKFAHAPERVNLKSLLLSLAA